MELLIDLHSHLDHCYFNDDRDKVVENAKKSGVKVILTAGTNAESNKEALKLALKYDIVKACLGIYPVTNFNKIENFDIEKELEFFTKNKSKFAAIGEVGLDFLDKNTNIKPQKDVFSQMIQIAEKLNKPIIVHSRKAEQECVEMLESSKLKKIIMHCFCGKKSLVKDIIDNGWFLTAPTCIVRGQQFQENVKITPINQLFCETDSPYLSPFKDAGNLLKQISAPIKMGNRNESAFIIESYKKIAEIKKMELKEVVNNIWMNWQKMF